MSPVGVIDLVSLLSIVTALGLFLYRRPDLPRACARLILLLLVAFLFHFLSNALEWLGLTSAFDTYEDYLELLEPIILVFFFYAFLQYLAHQEVQQAREEWEQIFNASGHPTVILDPEHVIVAANDALCRAAGKTAVELQGLKCYEVFHGPDTTASPEGCPMHALLENGTLKVVEMEMEAFGGIYLVSCTAVTDSEGQLQKIIHIATDITERKQAEQKVIQHQNQLRALVSQLTLSEEKERKHLAVELHDGVCQSLAMAKLKVDEQLNQQTSPEMLEFLSDLQKMLEGLIGETRGLTNNLGVPMLHQMGLNAAVEKWLETEITEKHGLVTRVVDKGLPQSLDDNTKAMLFRAVRELATNAMKHAQAQTLTVTLDAQGNELLLTIVDDGKGFEWLSPDEQDFRQAGYGLFSIHERASYMGGDMTITSGASQGTRVVLRVPLDDSRQATHDEASIESQA